MACQISFNMKKTIKSLSDLEYNDIFNAVLKALPEESAVCEENDEISTMADIENCTPAEIEQLEIEELNRGLEEIVIGPLVNEDHKDDTSDFDPAAEEGYLENFQNPPMEIGSPIHCSPVRSERELLKFENPPPFKKKGKKNNKQSILIPKRLTYSTDTNVEALERKYGLLSGKRKKKHEYGTSDKKKKFQNSQKETTKDRLLAWNELYANYQWGVWIQCSKKDCQKWRIVKEYEEDYKVPQEWFCAMNKDEERNSCSAPEESWDNFEFTEAEFVPGSIVWARMCGYPWWPAMIEDDPDCEEYYWINDFTDKVTQYHVTFLDKKVTRSWINVSDVRRFFHKEMIPKRLAQHLRILLQEAQDTAEEALDMSLVERLKTFSFVHRYRGKWPMASNFDSDAESAENTLNETAILLQEVDDLDSLNSLDMDLQPSNNEQSTSCKQLKATCNSNAFKTHKIYEQKQNCDASFSNKNINFASIQKPEKDKIPKDSAEKKKAFNNNNNCFSDSENKINNPKIKHKLFALPKNSKSKREFRHNPEKKENEKQLSEKFSSESHKPKSVKQNKKSNKDESNMNGKPKKKTTEEIPVAKKRKLLKNINSDKKIKFSVKQLNLNLDQIDANPATDMPVTKINVISSDTYSGSGSTDNTKKKVIVNLNNNAIDKKSTAEKIDNSFQNNNKKPSEEIFGNFQKSESSNSSKNETIQNSEHKKYSAGLEKTLCNKITSSQNETGHVKSNSDICLENNLSIDISENKMKDNTENINTKKAIGIPAGKIYSANKPIFSKKSKGFKLPLKEKDKQPLKNVHSTESCTTTEVTKAKKKLDVSGGKSKMENKENDLETKISNPSKHKIKAQGKGTSQNENNKTVPIKKITKHLSGKNDFISKQKSKNFKPPEVKQKAKSFISTNKDKETVFQTSIEDPIPTTATQNEENVGISQVPEIQVAINDVDSTNDEINLPKMLNNNIVKSLSPILESNNLEIDFVVKTADDLIADSPESNPFDAEEWDYLR